MVRKEQKKAWREFEEKMETNFHDNRKLFWSMIRSVGSTKSGTGPLRDSEGIRFVRREDKLRIWKEHFEGVSKKNALGDYCPYFKEAIEQEVEVQAASSLKVAPHDVLDVAFKAEEVAEAIGATKAGKAAGFDGVQVEVIKAGGDAMIASLTQLFNKAWASEELPDDWGRGLIVPIHKKGARDLCDNYRPITLLSVVGKMFGKVMNNRLQKVVDPLILDEQGGFRKGRGSLDQAFVLAETLQRRRVEKKTTYCAFIDIRKAYDTVWRAGLWARLWESRVRGKMWRMLRTMLSDVQSCVRIEGQMSEWFDVPLGVRQGCVLSPILFSIFLNFYAKEVVQGPGGVPVSDGDELLKILLFADDIALVAETREELQQMLDHLHVYSRQWRFTVNASKCAVMVCRPASSDLRVENCSLGSDEVKTVSEYQYLGLVFDQEMSWKPEALARADKAVAASMRLRKLFTHRYVGVRMKSLAWKVMVGSVLGYGQEVVALRVDLERRLESVQLKAGRIILHVGNRAGNEAVRGELGWFEMTRGRHIAKLRFWGRITKRSTSKWVRRVRDVVWTRGNRRSRTWQREIARLVRMCGLAEDKALLERDEIGLKAWYKRVRAKVEEVAQKEWKAGIGEKRTLRVYDQVKGALEFESFLDGHYGYGKKWKVRMRCGVSELGGDLRRVRGGEGYCRCCPDDVDDECETATHFLADCPLYAGLRRSLWARLTARLSAAVVADLRAIDFSLLILGKRPVRLSDHDAQVIESLCIRFIDACRRKRRTHISCLRVSCECVCGCKPYPTAVLPRVESKTPRVMAVMDI